MSTAVPTGPARHLLRGAFGLFERFAPGLGAALGERLCWRLPAPPRRRPPLPGRGEDIDLVVDGFRLTARRWESPGPRVYLAHGWAGFAAQFAELAATLTAAGLSVVAYDQPGHGDSWRAARTPSLGQFTAALEAVVAACGPARAVVTHSLGSFGLGWALRRGLRVERAVLLAPSAGVSDLADLFVEMSGSGPRIRSRLVARTPGRAGLPAEAMDLPELCSAVDVPPALVVHDSGDPWTPVAGGRAIVAAWPGARMLETTGLGHDGILGDPAVGRAVRDHVLAAGDAPVRAPSREAR